MPTSLYERGQRTSDPRPARATPPERWSGFFRRSLRIHGAGFLLLASVAAATTAQTVEATKSTPEATSLEEPSPGGESLLEQAEAAWADRAAGSQGHRAAPEPASKAARLYSEALSQNPGDLATRGKLLRALVFQGEYATRDRDAKLALFTSGQELGEEGLGQLAAMVGDRDALDQLSPEELGDRFREVDGAASVYYWTGVHWGLWGRHRGPVAAARQGVAGRIRDYATRAIALDPLLENAGPRRLLGQLHSEAPKIPIFTGWIDRRFAIEELTTASELFPHDLLSRFYLAKALYQHDKRSRDRAIAMLNEIVSTPPNPDWLVEEELVLRDARELLESAQR